MSHTTKFGEGWVIIHNSDYSGMAEIVSPSGDRFEVPACVMCLQMEALKERFQEVLGDFWFAEVKPEGKP